VLVLETRSLPTDDVAVLGSRAEPVSRPDAITVRGRADGRARPGGAQIAGTASSRTGLHKMETLGFDVTRVGDLHGNGAAAADRRGAICRR
jgi:methenyltetrahydromethanopterin cyclohydrolase